MDSVMGLMHMLLKQIVLKELTKLAQVMVAQEVEEVLLQAVGEVAHAMQIVLLHAEVKLLELKILMAQDLQPVVVLAHKTLGHLHVHAISVVVVELPEVVEVQALNVHVQI